MALSGITIDHSIKTRWPATCLGCLTYCVAVHSQNQGLWQYYETHVSSTLQQALATTELAAMPQIGESRAAYKSFGIDPGRHRISSEALYRRIRQGKSLYKINSLVDVNNLVSLQTGFSVGSYDTAHIGRPIVFRLGRPQESYAGIGKATIVLENMPVLADSDGPFGSPTSDSTRGMITLDTKEALTVIYSFSGRDTLETALELAERYFCQFSSSTNVERRIIEDEQR